MFNEEITDGLSDWKRSYRLTN